MSETLTIVYHSTTDSFLPIALPDGIDPKLLDNAALSDLQSPLGAAHSQSPSLRLHANAPATDGGERRALAVLDPLAKRLHVFEVAGPFAVSVQRALAECVATAATAQERRAKLVGELGTRKQQKKLQKAAARSTTKLDSEAELSRVLEASTTPVAPKENKKLSRLRTLLPPFNSSATQPKNIYKLGSVMPSTELEGVDCVAFVARVESGNVSSALRRFLSAANAQPRAKPQNWQRYLALLEHALALLRLRRIAVSPTELARERGFDAAIISALIARFWESEERTLVLSPFQRFRFAAFVVVLALLLFDLECEVDDFRAALQLRPKELAILLKSVGCVVEEKNGKQICQLDKIRI